MPPKTTISDVDAQIEKLRERKRLLIVKSAERFARAATKSGLAEMEISDDEIDGIFEEIAGRFRKIDAKSQVVPSPPTRRPADGGVGTATEISHGG